MLDYSLYLCTDSRYLPENELESKIEDAIKGGVTFVQVRDKSNDKEELLSVALRVKNVTDKYHISLVINDDVEVAKIIDASGVHLGQQDMPCLEARKILGKDKIIGISVTTVEEAIKATLEGADYIGVGAMFKSQTKPDAKVVSYGELIKIREVTCLPIVLIGGINEKTIPLFKGIGVQGFAMIRPILDNVNIEDNTRKLKRIIKS